MSFAPFPASDLAKLVLGYLMEEQLMTAYDEFLQASPYLDAFVNEYDRLCMISLRNILSEYRAMRLLVETCKPVELRRRLLQCSNLYEMVKLLITNVDLKKLCEEDSFNDNFRPKIAVLNCKKITPNKNKNSTTKSVRQMDDSCTNPAHETPISKDLMEQTGHNNESMFSEHMDETDPITQVNEAVSLQSEADLVSQEPLSDYEPVNETESNNDSMVLEKQNDPVLEEPITKTHEDRITDLEQINQIDCLTHLGRTEETLFGKIEPSSLEHNQIFNLEDTIKLVQMNQTKQSLNLGPTEHLTLSKQHKTDLEQTEPLPNQEQVTYIRQKEQITHVGQSELIPDAGQPDQIVPKLHSVSQPSKGIEPKTFTNLPVQSTEVNNAEILNGIKPGEQTIQSINLNIPLPTITSDIQKVYKQLATSYQDHCSSVKEIKPSIITEDTCIQTEDTSKLQSNTTAATKISSEFQPLPAINTNFIPSINSTNPNRLENVPPYKPVNINNTLSSIPNTKKRDSQKIIILSDVKFDGSQPQNRFSNPDSQTKSQFEGNDAEKCMFTKDEIMAMPTVFVASPADTKIRTNNHQSVRPSLKSLLVEVPTAVPEIPVIDISEESEKKSKKTKSIPPHLMHLKTVEPSNTLNLQPHTLLLTTSNPNEITVSSGMPLTNKILPNVVALSNDINLANSMPLISEAPKTPNLELHVKKPSSTPRRSSHIRVLDFTTPRRPLNDAILENCVSEEEAFLSKSPNTPSLTTGKSVEITTELMQNEQTVSCQNNDTKIKSKLNWDADLRALLVNNEEIKNESESKMKNKTYRKKKRPSENSNEEEKKVKKEKKDKKEKKKTNSYKHKSNKSTNENKDKANESVEAVSESLQVKPSIKVITERKTSRDSVKDDKNDKSNEALPPQECTPEVESIFLQHAIGAKLSISDILETPYKQAIYDLQMETPRFLGPEFSGDPLSDIKIMNIPTPRFLSTPKLQSTPSYSSRPTDYSSGGSYYKPDDNDYPTIVDDLTLPATSSPIEEVLKSDLKSETPFKGEDNPQSKTPNIRQSARPVRKCTKNVSYYDIANNKYSSTPTKKLDSHSSDKIKHRSSNETEPKSKSKTDSSKRRSTPKINPRVKKTPNKTSASKSKKTSGITNRCKDLTTNALAKISPSKSRRKSSTPRKLHCTKTFNSLNEQEPLTSIKEGSEQEEKTLSRWGNDSSRESKCEVEDIAKIQEYIEKTANSTVENPEDLICNKESALLRLELIKRGFDVATAKKIEQDLTDKPSTSNNNTFSSVIVSGDEVKKKVEPDKNIINVQNNEKIAVPETIQDADFKNIDIEEEYEEVLEFSVNQCDENSCNYIKMVHDESHVAKDKLTLFKETFCMEVCIEDDVIRLNTTPFMTLFNEDPQEVEIDNIDTKSNQCEKDEEININEVYDFSESYIRHYQEETEAAVLSISSGFDRFRTPRKELTADEAKCVEIFDSSLASLDTPMKTYSPKHKRKSVQHEEEKVNVFLIEQGCSGAEVTVEIESIEETNSEIQNLPKKRKRSISTKDEGNISKISKTTKYLKSIQNIDIETVLSRLHGP